MTRAFYSVFAISILLLTEISAPVQAAYYTDVSLEYQNIGIAGITLNPYTARFKVGASVSHNFAIEATYAGAVNDDAVNNLKLEVDQQTSLHIRYQGASSYNGLTLYLLLGQSWTTIKTSGPNAVPEEDYKDLSWGIGAEDFSRSVKNLYYSFQYTRYYENDDLTISGISLGLRYNFH